MSNSSSNSDFANIKIKCQLNYSVSVCGLVQRRFNFFSCILFIVQKHKHALMKIDMPRPLQGKCKCMIHFEFL